MKRIIHIILVAVALLAGTAYGHAQETEVDTDITLPRDSHFSIFDTTAVWHPRRILVVWPEMRLDFLLPRENNRSGVANLLLRDRYTGEIRLLDSAKDNPEYEQMVLLGFSNDTPSRPVLGIDTIKHRRYANHFEPGLYDAIVLYNNGKYITYEEISFEKEMQKVVDMTKLRLHKSDKNSQEWLKFRKFTDIVDKRTLIKNYDGTSPHKIIGYLFRPSGQAAYQSSFISLLKDNKTERVANTSFDGFFEMDIDSDNQVYTLDLFDVAGWPIYVEAQANTWIFAIH
jgi:hypothetical protein